MISALFRVAAERMPDIRFESAVYNSSPAIVIYNGDRLEGVFLIEITEGQITHFYAMRNPDKLTGVTTPREHQSIVTSATSARTAVTLPTSGGV